MSKLSGTAVLRVRSTYAVRGATWRGMRRVMLCALGACALPAWAAADDRPAPVVIELFTSQGCSSCPPADALLETLAMKEDVIALALHVDYWDYIGWEDAFADPAFTLRQKGYAHVAGARTIYTPQMIVGGMEHLVGVRPEELRSLIAQHQSTPAPIKVTLTRADGQLHIAAEAQEPQTEPLVVQLVRYHPSESVMITRGENAGQTVNYVNIVSSWTELGVWDGVEPLSMSEDISGMEPAVVILQQPGPGMIMGAARLW